MIQLPKKADLSNTRVLALMGNLLYLKKIHVKLLVIRKTFFIIA